MTPKRGSHARRRTLLLSAIVAVSLFLMALCLLNGWEGQDRLILQFRSADQLPAAEEAPWRDCALFQAGYGYLAEESVLSSALRAAPCTRYAVDPDYFEYAPYLPLYGHTLHAGDHGHAAATEGLVAQLCPIPEDAVGQTFTCSGETSTLVGVIRPPRGLAAALSYRSEDALFVLRDGQSTGTAFAECIYHSPADSPFAVSWLTEQSGLYDQLAAWTDTVTLRRLPRTLAAWCVGLWALTLYFPVRRRYLPRRRQLMAEARLSVQTDYFPRGTLRALPPVLLAFCLTLVQLLPLAAALTLCLGSLSIPAVYIPEKLLFPYLWDSLWKWLRAIRATILLDHPLTLTVLWQSLGVILCGLVGGLCLRHLCTKEANVHDVSA